MDVNRYRWYLELVRLGPNLVLSPCLLYPAIKCDSGTKYSSTLLEDVNLLPAG